MSSSLGFFASQISGHLFTLTGSYDALATVTVPSGGASSIVFSAIPQTGYKHLQLRVSFHDSGIAVGANLKMQFNGDSGSNYSDHFIRGNGASVYAGGDASNTFMYSGSYINGSSTLAGFVIDVLDYNSVNKYKTYRGFGGSDANGSGWAGMYSGTYQSLTGLNSITLTQDNSGSFAQYSQFSLYGVK